MERWNVPTCTAFGNVESSTGSSNNVYKYAGQWGYRNDGDDGLMHVGARYYDPLVGRFISADTYLGKIGNPQSLNRYVYVENNPVNAVDLTGHSPWLLVAIVVVAVVVITDPADAPPYNPIPRKRIPKLYNPPPPLPNPLPEKGPPPPEWRGDWLDPYEEGQRLIDEATDQQMKRLLDTIANIDDPSLGGY